MSQQLIINLLLMATLFILLNNEVSSWRRRRRSCWARNCRVSSWGYWSQCTKTCGSGTQTRRRYVTWYPSCGGSSCPSLVQTVSCNTRCCPVNCRYVSSRWGYCYGCGTNGKRTRYNYITQRAQCGGTCSVKYKETQTCNTGR